MIDPMVQSNEELKQAALKMGFDPNVVDSFMSVMNAPKVVKQYDPATDEILQRQIAWDNYKNTAPKIEGSGNLTEIESRAITEGVAEPIYNESTGKYEIKPSSKSVDPMQYVADNMATKYLTGKDKDARDNQAVAIQRLGIDKYLQAMPLPDLLTDSEVKARIDASNLLNTASSIVSQVQDQNGKVKNIQGLGTIGQYRPAFLTNKEGIQAKQDIINLSAQKMKEISGVAINEQEFERLSKSLPQPGDTEENIMRKSQNIAASIEVGLQMQEMAKRERLTLDQAYAKYGKDAFLSKGQPVPAWLAKNDTTLTNKPGNTPSSSMKQDVSTLQKRLQDSGYSQAQIDSYLKLKGLQ